MRHIATAMREPDGQRVERAGEQERRASGGDV